MSIASSDPLFRIIDKKSDLDESVSVWAYSQIREGSHLNENVIISNQVYVGPGVEIGKNSKIQNNAMIYEPAIIGEGVFIGPGVILTNDHYPRAINPDMTQKLATDWSPVGVTIEDGAAVGAGSVCVAPLVIGQWAVIAAGSVVVKNVKKFSLVAGVPARQIGWVGKYGVPLVKEDECNYFCPETKEKYILNNDGDMNCVEE
jgi:UDP-2-acetamido-3-amino-2,3-dideoxy-glucuronate N-acetyltransferase